MRIDPALAPRRGVARLRLGVAGLLGLLECGCVGGTRIDGACMDCGAPSP